MPNSPQSRPPRSANPLLFFIPRHILHIYKAGSEFRDIDFSPLPTLTTQSEPYQMFFLDSNRFQMMQFSHGSKGIERLVEIVENWFGNFGNFGPGFVSALHVLSFEPYFQCK